jgi:carbonic anhydrase/acetyltransferase-like protein (isoleucine patch superfamily)
VIESLDGHLPEIADTAWVHATAVIIGDVEIGDESSVWPGAVVRGDFGPIRIGARTCVQDNAVIHSDRAGTHIGNDCIIGHLAFVEEAIVGDECLVGTGARVLNGVRLEPGAVVAAGAVVLGETVVPTGFRAQGVPARIVPCTSPKPGYVKDGAARYVEMARRHAGDFARR